MTNFVVYDVFTDAAFGGNQLAIIPDAAKLAQDDLQRIAREFNFSETTFVYPPADPVNTAKVRIFTPTMEVPFAGHPTIGTAIALHDLGHDQEMVLELGIGPIPCHVSSSGARFQTNAPLQRLDTPDQSLVAAALGLQPSDICTGNHAPVQVSLGLPFVIAELQDNKALECCNPSLDHIKKGAALHPGGLDFALFAYVRQDDVINARMFAPLDNIPEDPATGSAAATLAALLTEASKTAQQLTIHQGVAMGRPSIIHAATDLTQPVTVTISGNAIKTMQGQLTL